jgi:hypothetical protein
MRHSLRSKIGWAYAGVALLVVALVLAQYLALAGIESRVDRSDIVAAFLQDSLEMRRFEKSSTRTRIPPTWLPHAGMRPLRCRDWRSIERF